MKPFLFGLIPGICAAAVAFYVLTLKNAELNAVQSEVAQIKEKFSEIKDVDLEEYVHLKDQAKKYEKADEILGKILVVFMANLGLKVSKNQQQWMEQPKPDIREPIAALPKKEVEPPPSAAAAVKSTPPTAEAGLEDLTAKTEDQFLRRPPYRDFKAALDRSQKVTVLTGAVQALMGNFDGEVLLQDKTWKMALTFHGTMQGDQLTGDSSVELTDEMGNVFSRASSNGNLTGFRQLPDSNRAVLVTDEGGGNYFQLFYVRQEDRFVGNYFKKTDTNIYERRGRVRLFRRH